MTSSLRLTLTPPPSVNHIYCRGRGGRVFRSKSYITWLRMNHLLVGRPGLVPSPAAVRFTFHGGKGFRAKRDLDNCEKALMDFLVHSGVLLDDSYEHVPLISKKYISPAKPSDKAYVVVAVRQIGIVNAKAGD